MASRFTLASPGGNLVLVTFYGRLSVITAVLSGSNSVWLVIEVLFVTTLLVLLGNGLFHWRECESVMNYGCIIQRFRIRIFLKTCIKACKCRTICWQLCASEVSDTKQLSIHHAEQWILIGPKICNFQWAILYWKVLVQCTYTLQYC